MGDLILGPVVEATVSKVIAVASDQLNLALGWDEDLQKFCSKMETLQGVLQDADEKFVSGHPSLKHWLQQLRTVADEANDILEEVAYENMRRHMAVQKSKHKKVRYLFSQSDPRDLVFRLKMANKVKNLNKSLDEINRWASELELLYKLVNTGGEPRAGAGLETHSFLPSKVFGREEDVSKIVSLLIDSSNRHDLPVITIVGMPGLGKTTLAKAVLENDKIGEHFGENKMWVCVSENFDVKKILMEMLKSISESSGGDGHIGSNEIVMKAIQKKLREQNYLLILDDVWNEERQPWEHLRDCLLGISKNKGSRVLVTTRLQKVASVMAVSEQHIHCPRRLNEDECWTIIRQRAFGDNSVGEELEAIGKQIAKRCKGIPLVASIIGATLQKKRSINEWQATAKNDVWDSLEPEKDIFNIIKFSYDRLPTLALKRCFAFCSIFPQDFVMEREMLIQLWMGQGFLESSKESCMASEDIGEKYFKDLISYYLFQEEKRDSLGSVKSCKMHDLIHDFAKVISKPETLIDNEGLGSNISGHVRHLNLIDGKATVSTISGDVAKKLKTLFSRHGFSSGVQVDFKRLRVLSLDGASDAKQLPTCIGNLKSLRYLDISGTQIEKLPKFITKLYNLQTFRFMGCKSLELPLRGIGDLINLKHIYFDDEERMPADLGKLTKLQTLPLFFVGTTKGHRIEELGSLRGLKGRLDIHKLELVKGKSEAKGAKLHEKAVEDLELRWQGGVDNQNNDEDVLKGLKPHLNTRRLSIRGYGGRNLASWLFLLKKLVDLTIDSCWMLCRIPGINGFSSLERLSVEWCNELTSLGDDDGALTSMSLKELSIVGCGKLKRFSISGLSSLKQLYINSCDELTSLGDGDGDGDGALTSTSLKELSIVGCGMLKRFSVSRLSSLEQLYVNSCDELTSLGDGDGALHSMSLKELSIRGCGKLKSFLVCGLSSLEELKIENCKVISRIGDSLSSSRGLKILILSFCPKLNFFPSLEGLVSLKTVIVRGCDGLECLPRGLSSCTALEELKIWRCSNLVSIPEEFKQLPSLVQLKIAYCPN